MLLECLLYLQYSRLHVDSDDYFPSPPHRNAVHTGLYVVRLDIRLSSSVPSLRTRQLSTH